MLSLIRKPSQYLLFLRIISVVSFFSDKNVRKKTGKEKRKDRNSNNKTYLSRVMRKPTFWFPTWSDTNQTVQLQKMARGLKFRIKKEEVLCYMYLCSENKGADQLRGHREADLRLCFRICKNPVFLRRGSNVLDKNFTED